MTTNEASAIVASLKLMKSHTVEEVSEAIGVWFRWYKATDWNYRHYANMIIVFTERCDSEIAALELIRSHDVTESSIKNALRLVKVYDDYVKSGPASIDWFESLDWKRINLINRATARHDRWTLRREPIFDGSPSAWLRIEELGAARSKL